jgi:quercetin dioxygenase-like cupin family protein
MKSSDIAIILKRFDQPDETRTFPKGRFDTIRIGGVTIGRAKYEPGWRWSEHIGPSILSGVAIAAFDDGRVFELGPGQAFYIPPIPHDSWVVGDEPYVSLHFLGADQYAK